MSALTDVERIAVATALVLIFALCVLFLRRMTDAERRMTGAEQRVNDSAHRVTDAERRLTDAERRLTNAERQSLPDSNKRPIGFLANLEPA
jgi:hypothetical protein